MLEEVLDKLGPTFKQTIYDELERAGMHIDSPSPSLPEVERMFKKLFGPDVAALLMKNLRKRA